MQILNSNMLLTTNMQMQCNTIMGCLPWSAFVYASLARRLEEEGIIHYQMETNFVHPFHHIEQLGIHP